MFRLLLRGLTYYWRTNLAVLLGVVTGTAVITGALIVGDSVRGSLRQMTLDRLGEIDHVLQSHRFFREELAGEFMKQRDIRLRFDAIAPALTTPAGLEYRQTKSTSRVNQVRLYGLDDRLWDLLDHGGVAAPADREIVVNQRVAEQLSVNAGDEITAWIEIPSTIPRGSLFGERDETSRELVLTVKAVLGVELGAGRLELNPNQQLPLVAYVSLDALQSAMGLERIRPSRDKPKGAPARVNSLFVKAKSPSDRSGETAGDAASELTGGLANVQRLSDLGLRLRVNEQFGYLSLESDQQILADRYAEVARRTAARLGLTVSPVLAYLVNEMTVAGDPDSQAVYFIAAGVEFESMNDPPFGPLTFVGARPGLPLSADEIILNDWLAEDLDASVGDRVKIKYHEVGSHGELPEISRTFTIAGIVQMADSPAGDPGLVPDVEGITDAETFRDWDQPFPMDLNRITARDEEYWDRYRATPKAFVSLAAAQEMWGSVYGHLTSFRISPLPDETLEESARTLTRALRREVEPAETGFVFQPVKFNGLQAATGTTDFSGLFLGFSFFIILSATILIDLLLRLGIERRTTSIGLLSAVGFSPRQVQRLFLAERMMIVVAGGLVGIVAAVGYARLMVYGLKTWWRGAIGTQFLDVYLTWPSLCIGFSISVVVTSLAVWWGIRRLRALSTRELLSGATDAGRTAASQQRRGRRNSQVAVASLAVAVMLVIACLSGLAGSTEAFGGLSWQVVAFFVVGILMLVAGVSSLSTWLNADRTFAVRGGGLAGIRRLGMRNATRHRRRSVMTVGLIASATFVIVAVTAGHRNPAMETPVKQSGNGGFTLVAESSRPILFDLNTQEGRERLGIRVPDQAQNVELLRQVIGQMQVMPFRVKPVEEASCLNIYQTRLPTILGVPPAMIERGGFKFSGTPGENPWTLLNESPDDGCIPVLGDMNTLLYSLHKGIGDTIVGPSEQNPQFTLKIAGMFDGSVFQGVLLMSEENFLSLFPEQSGYQYFLIDVPLPDAAELSDLLETSLAEYGFDAEPVAERLAAFLAVQNTYLSTFQTLGGLGLLLGTLGLATVMLRNVLERRSELGLLRAVGFQNRTLGWLVLWENAFLLVWGLVSGTVSALLAMTPHLSSTGADVPWMAGGLILAGVFVVGMLAGLLAVYEAVRTPILATLRSD